ncbi:hypothetical protein M422DRAFT_251829 [Sphaerobolus stellatus SS14]|uniref:Uncharacterized protein n=1 Tax=Sphaerobolus stellatus (strain SS14) TaxID=990650 RepID=A0A0C9VCY0_SPHS4|nr:hypothetical protein M422DRAFT_251829 [Sphaerobolus stellatus SS14]
MPNDSKGKTRGSGSLRTRGRNLRFQRKFQGHGSGHIALHIPSQEANIPSTSQTIETETAVTHYLLPLIDHRTGAWYYSPITDHHAYQAAAVDQAYPEPRYNGDVEGWDNV